MPSLVSEGASNTAVHGAEAWEERARGQAIVMAMWVLLPTAARNGYRRGPEKVAKKLRVTSVSAMVPILYSLSGMTWKGACRGLVGYDVS